MLYTLLIVLVWVHSSLQEGCSVNFTDLGFPFDITAPLIFTSDSFEFIYPPLTNSPQDGSFEILEDQVVVFAYPGGSFSIKGETLDSTGQYVTCNKNSSFELEDGTFFNYFDTQCYKSDHYLATARESQDSCVNNGSTIEIGYSIIDNQFVTQTVICFDKNFGVPQQSTTVVTPYSQFQKGIIFSGPKQDDNIFDPKLDLDEIYLPENQQSRVNALLGLPENSTKYIDTGFNLIYFNGEPLTDPTIFMYSTQQIAAQNYLDMAPIWCAFQLGNWYYILEDIRQYSINYGKNLTVITGTSGVLKLPHEETGEEVEICLYKDYIKVSEIFWKVIYEPQSQRAITVVVHNNPYLDSEAVVKICEDISGDVAWLQIDSPGDVTKGYSYICTYEGLKAALPQIPTLDVVGPLI